jgi:hypothetical protein
MGGWHLVMEGVGLTNKLVLPVECQGGLSNASPDPPC